MRGIAALLLLSALVLPACGGSAEPLTRDEYSGKLIAVMRGLDWSAGSDVQGLDDLAERYEDAADELASVRPPDEAAASHARLVAGMRAYGAKLADLERTVRSGKLARMAEYQALSTGVVRALNELAAMGYARRRH
jgi:hypothetical protein